MISILLLQDHMNISKSNFADLLKILCFWSAVIKEAKRNPLQSWTKICRYVDNLNVDEIWLFWDKRIISYRYKDIHAVADLLMISYGLEFADMLMIWMST